MGPQLLRLAGAARLAPRLLVRPRGALAAAALARGGDALALRLSLPRQTGGLRALSGAAPTKEDPKRDAAREQPKPKPQAPPTGGSAAEEPPTAQEQFNAATETATAHAKEAGSRLKQLVRNYGAVGVGVYGGIYVGTLGLLYGLVGSHVIAAGDAISMLKSTGLDNFVDISSMNPKTGDFALAWILTKFTEPLRLVLAVSITPPIARAIGWAPPKADNDPDADGETTSSSASSSSSSPKTGSK